MTRKILESIVEQIRSSLPKEKLNSPSPVSLHEPWFKGNEWKYVKECIDTGWVSSVGKYVDLFEKNVAEYTGVKRAIAVGNGTQALHMSLLLSGVKPSDEVLVPALSFVATANAVSYCQATPHFLDSTEETLGIDAQKLKTYLKENTKLENGVCKNKKTGNVIRALIVMHTYGHPAHLDSILELCREFNITLIEDAAEAIGSLYKSKHVGHWGKFSALSFNGNKTITTGGGGAILTNDDELGTLAKHLTTTAKRPHPWRFDHDFIGFNYRMPNINAALGCAQLESLPGYIEYKRALAKRYGEAFEGLEGVRFFREPKDCTSNYWLNTLLLENSLVPKKDELLELTNKANLQCRPTWTLLHRLPMYQTCPRMDLSQSENLEQRLINIPSSPILGADA